MEAITYVNLADYENVDPPHFERSNFYYSFSVLPREERIAINSIYAFCSYIDDIVDSSQDDNEIDILKKKKRLDWWENVVEKMYEDKLASPLLAPLVNVINRFGIPKQYLIALIDGCRRDLSQNRYETFDDLKTYCYSVASIVGLISIEIFGYKYEETKNYAINLGYALQLTNILRDIKVDKDRGYIYLPQEDLRRFGYTEEQLINEVYNDNFIELMRFEAKRIREYYHKARTCLHPDERMTVFTAEVIDAIYYRLLEKIELKEFNVYKKKIRVATVHKMLIALKHWLSVHIFVGRFEK